MLSDTPPRRPCPLTWSPQALPLKLWMLWVFQVVPPPHCVFLDSGSVFPHCFPQRKRRCCFSSRPWPFRPPSPQLRVQQGVAGAEVAHVASQQEVRGTSQGGGAVGAPRCWGQGTRRGARRAPWSGGHLGVVGEAGTEIRLNRIPRGEAGSCGGRCGRTACLLMLV